MAAANYNTDLAVLDLCESIGSFSTIAVSGSGNMALGAGPDFVFQGTNAVDVKIGGAALRGMVSNAQGVITNVAGLHFFVWCQTATAGVMDTKAAGGKRIAIGSSTANYMEFYVDGGDTNLEGGYKMYPVRYTTVADNPNGVYSNGSPAANPSFVGAMLKNTGVSVKSSNFSVDAMRYGNGILYVDDACFELRVPAPRSQAPLPPVMTRRPSGASAPRLRVESHSKASWPLAKTALVSRRHVSSQTPTSWSQSRTLNSQTPTLQNLPWTTPAPWPL